MKKLLYLLPFLVALSCGERSASDHDGNNRTSAGDVEKNSGENISPQLEDSVDRFTLDSLYSAPENKKEKGNELEGGD